MFKAVATRSVWRPLQPLTHRGYALIWASALISNLGTWMQIVAVGTLVTARTNKAGWSAAVAAAATLPMAALIPVGGAIADRTDRRIWLVSTTLVEMTAAFALTLLAAKHLADPLLVTVMVLGGSSAAALGVAAFQAMLPDLVTSDELAAAMSLSSAQFNIGRVLGPALSGPVLAAGGYVWAFGLNAVSFSTVVVALLLVRLPPLPQRSKDEGLGRSMIIGMRAAISEPSCRTAILLIGAVGLGLSPFIALIPAVAVLRLHSGSWGTSLLTTAQGLGAVVGALLLPALVVRLRRSGVVAFAAPALCLLLIFYGTSTRLAVAAVILIGVGMLYIMVIATLTTTVQAQAPVELRGRIVGLFMTMFTTSYSVGAVVQGYSADHVGLPVATTVGAGMFLGWAAPVVWLGSRRLKQLDGMSGAPPRDDAMTAS